MRIPIGMRCAARWVRVDRGAVAAEYVLLAALIAVVIIAAVVFLSDSLVGLFDETASSVADF